MLTTKGTSLAILAALLAGCSRAPEGGSTASAPPPDGPPWFEDVAVARGIEFAWDSGHRGRHHMPESLGGGGALFDMDGDGDLDAYLPQGGDLTQPAETYEPNQLFENLGDGTFRDATEESGTGHRGYGMGVACGDVDNDGDVDLYVTNVGANVLYSNLGDGRFIDATDAAGVGHPGFGTGAAFLDYDRDGDLDLFVLNYLNWSVETEIDCRGSTGVPDYCLPANYASPARDVLYRNDGTGVFTDVTDAAGMSSGVATGLGIVCGDFNGDGWIDIFIANDGMPDLLWLNRRDGTFVEFGMMYGAALDQEGKAKAGMGVATADLDGDRDLDLIVCNLRSEADSVLINEGTYFRDATILTGVSGATRAFTRFGVGLADFDNDGVLDLFEANGRVQVFDDAFGDDPYAEPNTVMRGQRGPRFDLVRPRGGTKTPLIATSRAAVFGDIDGDGGIDVLVTNRNAQVHLLRNIVAERGHWLMLDVVNEVGSPAIGARVQLQVAERNVRRDVQAAYSFLASNDPRVHVGLGDHSAPVPVAVQWPDGLAERFEPAPVDTVTTIRRGTGTPLQ